MDHLWLSHATGGHGRRPNSNSTWVYRASITDYGVLVSCNVHGIEHLIDLGSSQIVRAHIPHNQMAIGAICDQFLTGLLQGFGDGSCIRDNLNAVFTELGRGHLLELDG